MTKRTLILLSLVIAVLTMSIGTQAAFSGKSPDAPSCGRRGSRGFFLGRSPDHRSGFFTHIQNGEGCLPGTWPALDSHRLYLPLVACTDRQPSPPPPLICMVEEESNDVHDGAQAVVARCVEGDTDGYGDLDWYKLNVCSGPIDQVILSLDGPGDGANLDLYLYADPPGWPLYSSEGVEADETITATGVLTGVYYALVQPLAGKGDYKLTFEVRR